MTVKINEYRNGVELWKSNKIIGGYSINYSISSIPTLSIQLPLECAEFVTKRCEIKVTHEDFQFLGLVNAYDIDYKTQIIKVDLIHILQEFEYEFLPENMIVKNVSIPNLYTFPYNLGRNLWTVNTDTVANNSFIEYLYSSQDKLQAIGDTLKQTRDLEYRVRNDQGRVLEIGVFGDSVLTLDTRKIISLTQKYSFTEVINRIKVMSGNVGNGTGQMTLRHIFFNPSLMSVGFPVTISATNVNTDEFFNPINVDVKTGSNDGFEYYMSDTASILEQNGNIYEAKLNISDLYPVPDTGQEIFDADREAMYLRIRNAGERYLRLHRASNIITIEYGSLGTSLQVGDKVRFKKDIQHRAVTLCGMENCNITVGGEYYVLSRSITISSAGEETNSVTLINRITAFRPSKDSSLGLIAGSVGKVNKELKLQNYQRKSSTHTSHWEMTNQMLSLASTIDVEFEIEKDLDFWYSWAMRFRVLPLKTTATSGGIAIAPTSLSIASITPTLSPSNHPSGLATVHNVNPINPVISPDPHTHGIVITSDIQEIAPSPGLIEIFIDGVNITPFLILQYPTDYPTPMNNYNTPSWIPLGGGINDKYDIIECLKLAGVWSSIGQAGKHRVKVTASGGVAMIEMRFDFQFSHTNR